MTLEDSVRRFLGPFCGLTLEESIGRFISLPFLLWLSLSVSPDVLGRVSSSLDFAAGSRGVDEARAKVGGILFNLETFDELAGELSVLKSVEKSAALD